MTRSIAAVATVLALLMTAALSTVASAQEDFTKEKERYYATRDACGGEDNMRLDTRPSSYAGGCALLVSPVNEVLNVNGGAVSEVYPQSDGESYLIDVDEELTGQITTYGFFGRGTSVGVATFDVTVKASHGMFDTVTLVDETIENIVLTGAEQSLEFAADIPDDLADLELRNFEMTLTIRGVHGAVTLDTDGDSFITVPYLEPVEAAA